MAFRELLEGASVVGEPMSVKFSILEKSIATGNAPMVFSNLEESPGHRAAINILTRQRLCEYFGVAPGELIDILAWAMENPSEPVIVPKEESPVMDNTMEGVDLGRLPIPWHYPVDA